MARRVALLLLLALPIPSQSWAAEPMAAKVVTGGWDRARWGMTGDELQAVYDHRLKVLASPMQFGTAYAALALPDLNVAGSRFTALFQMDRATDRLGQVAVERRRHYATVALFRRIEAEMIGRHGQP